MNNINEEVVQSIIKKLKEQEGIHQGKYDNIIIYKDGHKVKKEFDNRIIDISKVPNDPYDYIVTVLQLEKIYKMNADLNKFNDYFSDFISEVIIYNYTTATNEMSAYEGSRKMFQYQEELQY